MLGKHFKEHTDFLKTIMNIVILVSGAAGSIINLVKGNNIPLLLSIGAMVVVIVFVLAELKDRRDRKKEAEKVVKEVSAAQAQAAGAPIPYPTVFSQTGAASSERMYWNNGGRLVLRLVAPRVPEVKS